jgi:hypothetical protein
MKMRHFVVTAAAALLMSTAAQAADPFSITSSTFKDGTMLPKKAAGANKANPNCVGENVSPLTCSGRADEQARRSRERRDRHGRPVRQSVSELIRDGRMGAA